jgi:hypothetical protein
MFSVYRELAGAASPSHVTEASFTSGDVELVVARGRTLDIFKPDLVARDPRLTLSFSAELESRIEGVSRVPLGENEYDALIVAFSDAKVWIWGAF